MSTKKKKAEASSSNSKASPSTNKAASKTNLQDTTSNGVILLGVVACFILSGFAALLYQTAWMRQFSLVFGTSELAVAAVLAAYMAGLALGASIAAKYVHKVTRPVLFYGVLEAGIAIAALAVPLLLKLASILYIGMLGTQPEPIDASGLGQSFFYLLVAFVVLAIPTAFMGATLPLLTKYVVQSKQQIGSRVGLLYATNTLGAIGGTLVAGFVLLPLLGLNGTVYVGVVINLFVFVLAALIAKAVHAKTMDLAETDTESKSKEKIDAPELSEQDTGPNGAWILPIMLLSGAISFVYEVLWTRLLGHVLGGSITAFSTMLAGFLGGIAIGSAIASRFANTKRQAISIFIAVQCGIAFTSILIYQLMPLLLPEGNGGLSGNVIMAILVLLPATIFIGATFPLAVRILAIHKEDAGPSSARVYAWNTVGAIVGATVAAFFLIPILKYEGAIKLAVLVNILLALAAALLLNTQSQGKLKRISVIATLLIGTAIAIFYQPAMPEAVLRSSPVFAIDTGEIRYYEVGRSATVVVIEDQGALHIRTNGLPEATTNLKGSPPSVHNQKMLSTMPVLARPESESMLVIGLGGGVVLEGVPNSIKNIDVIELEPQVVKANQSIGAERAIDPLQDPRINLIVNDARSALALTDKRYDAIVSQPSHPWTAGASHLYTREFMTLAKEHLTPNGVFLQWMNSQFVDEHLLRSLSATVVDVFPHVRVYQWNPEVLFFLGSEQPLDVEQAILASGGAPLTDDILHYLEKGVGSLEDVVMALAMDQINVERFALGGQVITDDNNIIATRSAQVMARDEDLGGLRLAKVIADYDPLLQENSEIRKSIASYLNFPYISRRLQTQRMTQRAIDLADSLYQAGDLQALVMIGQGQRLQGEAQEAENNIRRALEANPSNQQTRYSLLSPWLAELMLDQEVPDYIENELSELKGTAGATIDGLFALQRDDLHRLVELDSVLANVSPSDLWYQASVKLRAQWRTRVTTPSLQPRLANEAIQLVDSALVFFQDSEFFNLRLQAAAIAEDYASLLQTARRLNIMNSARIQQAVDENLDLPSVEIIGLLALEKQVASSLEILSNASDVDQETVSVVKDSNLLAMSQLETLASRLDP